MAGNIPPPNTPLVDQRGNVTPEWYRWLSRKEAAIGSGEIGTSGGLAGGGPISSGITLSIADKGVTDGKLRDSIACSVIGRFQNSGGTPTDIQATDNNRVLMRLDDILVFKELSATLVGAQPDDPTLTALAAFNTNGIVVQTAADTFAGRTLTAPAAGISVSNGGGVAGNPTLALANDLAALEALSGTNTIYYRSGVDTWSAVTVGSTLTFSGGTLSVTGAPVTKTDDTNVTATLGGSASTGAVNAFSITLGWTGQLSPGRGGTGIASYAVGDILYASGSTTLSKLADVATGNVLISGGVTTAPSWGKVGLTTHVSGTLPVGNGGTGVTTSTGSGANVLGTAPTIAGGSITGLTTFTGPDGSVVAGNNPGIAFSSFTDSGIGANAQNLAIWESGAIAVNIADVAKEVRLPSNYALSWSSATNNNAVNDTTLSRSSAGVLAPNGPFQMKSYTVAGVPSAATSGAGSMIYVSNESGGAVAAFSDGTNWRRVTDRIVIS